MLSMLEAWDRQPGTLPPDPKDGPVEVIQALIVKAQMIEDGQVMFIFPRGEEVPSLIAKVDGKAFVTGAHGYASDVKRPGMLRGLVLRPPSFKAKLVSVETRDAAARPGVTVVHDGDFVGVAAPSEHAAAAALAAIRAEWQSVSQPSDKEILHT